MFCDVFGHFRLLSVAKRRHSPGAYVAVVAALLAGCASVAPLTAESPAAAKQDAVAARAKARWDALIKLDVAGAYEYLSPASRATMPLDVYKAKHKVGMYRQAKVDDVKCDGDSCTVQLSITYEYKQFKPVTTPLTEKWIISQGQAWIVDRS